MSVVERWLLLIIFVPLVTLILVGALFGIRELRRSRRARMTHDRINEIGVKRGDT